MLIPLKPCTYPGCNKLVKSGRCESHIKQADKAYDKEREKSAERKFIHSDRWRMIRKIKLSNDPLCEKCKNKMLVTVATLVHHIDQDEGNNVDENLMSLCSACHEEIHGPGRFKRRY